MNFITSLLLIQHKNLRKFAMSLYIAKKDEKRCQECGFCRDFVCRNEQCVGCGACSLACPNQAIEMVPGERGEDICIKVEGKSFALPDGITIRQALELLGYSIAKYPKEGQLFVPCEVGGCWSCAVKINGELKPSCVTPIKEGMEIEFPADYTPLRLVGGFMGHMVGGVGTPWELKHVHGYIEAACFACGCNFRCPQCQNWSTTYRGKGLPLTPEEAARMMTATRHRYKVDRMAISGGECTLNGPWLLNYLKELRRLNPDENARLHVDTNGSLLTNDYIDDLAKAGMTDVGIDLKSLALDTFVRITGLKNKELAQRYKETAWEAVNYIRQNHREIFLGIGIPYNEDLISIEEIRQMGERILDIDPEIQVCVLDYRPEFRRRDISRPSYQEMEQVYITLKRVGLKAVLCQTAYGHIGP